MACLPCSSTTESKRTRKKLCVILEDDGFKFLYVVSSLKLEVQMLMTYFLLSEKKYEGKQPLCKINLNKILSALVCFKDWVMTIE